MKWWPFRRPKPVSNFSEELFAASATPRISVAEHLLARFRVEFQMRQHMIVDIGNGPERWNTGCIDTDDLRKVHGYHFRIKGYDRFGWPDGHPDSPAGIADIGMSITPLAVATATVVELIGSAAECPAD